MLFRSDTGGATTTASLSVRVNSLPVVQSVAAQKVTAGRSIRLTLKAADADGDKLVFHAVSLPTGATLSAAGVFNWPYAVPTGSHAVTVAASDNDGSGPPVSFTIDVTGAAATLTTASVSGSGGGGAADSTLIALAAGMLLIRRRHAKK